MRRVIVRHEGFNRKRRREIARTHAKYGIKVPARFKYTNLVRV